MHSIIPLFEIVVFIEAFELFLVFDIACIYVSSVQYIQVCVAHVQLHSELVFFTLFVQQIKRTSHTNDHNPFHYPHALPSKTFPKTTTLKKMK